MMKFVNRESELKFLNDCYEKDESSLVVLYGRRRVGKTALANHFSKDKNTVYYLATEENEKQNLNAFKNLVADFTDNNLLKSAKVDEWQPVFETLVKETKAKIVIVLDEFQYLGKSNPTFPSIFQKIWDTFLKDKNIMVILCGSYISMMQSQTLDYSSPLYGRRTGQIKLKQISFKYYNEFFTSFNRRELIERYAVTGGVPKYIEAFNENSNIFEAIENNILSKSSFLYDEANFLLRREVTEVGTYISIIKTIAEGNQKLSQIASRLEVSQSNLSKYLSTLQKLDILERQVPITQENPAKSKSGLYRINDNYILFWFMFIYPNISYIESDNTNIVVQKIKKSFIDRHVSFVYENVCMQKMWELSSQNTWDFYFSKAGRWWNSNNEIDIVAIDNASNNIIFGECKYKNTKTGMDVLQKLIKKAQQVDYKKADRKEYYILFSISGFTDELIEFCKSKDNIVLSD